MEVTRELLRGSELPTCEQIRRQIERGLEVHELPFLSLLPRDALVAGDVLALEPGLYRRGFGGVRLEDLVLVTEDGCERLAQHPYDLQP